MNETNSCPRCGSELTSEAPQGLCPKCLMAEVMTSEGHRPSEMSTLSAADRESTGSNCVKVGPLNADTIVATEETPGRYSVLGEYGKGGMGRVLLVHDEHLGRDIALKELLPDLGDGSTPTPARHSKEMAARFLREAKITGQLEHPSITPVHEIGRKADGTLYYTMKLVRGRTLSQAIKSAKNFEERLKLLPHFVDLCNAIAYAHSRGVIHRDIKPSNVMIGDYGETVIIDWGLAKVKSAKEASDPPSTPGQKTVLGMRTNTKLDDDSGKTQHGQAMGTPAYMPPEQAAGDLDNIDERSDIYSLGAVLFEILTGQPPVEGKSVAEILWNVIAGKIRKVRAVEPKCQTDLAAIVEKAMTLEPERRNQSAMELGEMVQKWKPKKKRSKPVLIAEVIALLLLITIPTAIAVLNHLTHVAVEKKIELLQEEGVLPLFSGLGQKIGSRAATDSFDVNEAHRNVSPQDRLLALQYDEPSMRLLGNLDPLAQRLKSLYSSSDEFSLAVPTEEREQALRLLVADLATQTELIQKIKSIALMEPATTAQIHRAMPRNRKSDFDDSKPWLLGPPVERLLAESYLALLNGSEETYLDNLSTWVKLHQHVTDVPESKNTYTTINAANKMRRYTTLFYEDGLLSPALALRALALIEHLLNQEIWARAQKHEREDFVWFYREFEDGSINSALQELDLVPATVLDHLQVKIMGSESLSFIRNLDMLSLLDKLSLLAKSELRPYSEFRQNVLPMRDDLMKYSWLRPMSNYFVRGYINERIYAQFHARRAELDLDRISIALAMFKSSHGAYPKHLEELSPKYLDHVPADPFGDALGDPFIYRPEGNSFKLYSVGPNGEDDLGESSAAWPNWDPAEQVGGSEPDDITSEIDPT